MHSIRGQEENYNISVFYYLSNNNFVLKLYFLCISTILANMPHISTLNWNHHTHIWLDLDETLASTVMGMLEIAHAQGKLLSIRSLEDITKYDFPGLDPTLTEVDSNHVWECYGQSTLDPLSVPIVPGALLWVELLEKRGVTLSVITARSDDQEWKKPRTLDWVSTHFPRIEDIHFVNHFSKDARPKSEVCKASGITLMIDDHTENARDLCGHGISIILLEKPWNRNDLFEHPLLYRAKDWNEIIQSLQK